MGQIQAFLVSGIVVVADEREKIGRIKREREFAIWVVVAGAEVVAGERVCWTKLSLIFC